MSFTNLPSDQQIDILLHLSPIDLLNTCQTNRHLNSLCQNNPRLNQHFEYLTNRYFGVDRLYGDNWYQTFLTINKDIQITADQLTKLLPLKVKRHLNLKEIRKDLAEQLRLALFSVKSFNLAIEEIVSYFIMDEQTLYEFTGKRIDIGRVFIKRETTHNVKLIVDAVLGKYLRYRE